MLSCRCDFTVQFGSSDPTSVFQLLQQACLQMISISHSIHQKETNPTKSPQPYLYHKFVYNRFMWGECMSVCVSKCMWVYRSVSQPTQHNVHCVVGVYSQKPTFREVFLHCFVITLKHSFLS